MGARNQVAGNIDSYIDFCSEYVSLYGDVILSLGRSPDYNGLALPAQQRSKKKFKKKIKKIVDRFGRLQREQARNTCGCEGRVWVVLPPHPPIFMEDLGGAKPP